MGIIERRQREKEQRRADIKEAAKKVFSERGFKNTTINDIARTAQLSPGTLYLYFKNKEELYTSLSIDMLRIMNENIDAVINIETLSLEEKLSSIIEIFIRMYEHDAKILINIFHLQSAEALDRLSPEVIQEIKEISSKSHKGLACIIQEGMDQGLFKNEHPVAIADIIWGIFTGVVLWVESKRQLDQEKNFAKKTLETAFDLFFQGLRVS